MSWQNNCNHSLVGYIHTGHCRSVHESEMVTESQNKYGLGRAGDQATQLDTKSSGRLET